MLEREGRDPAESGVPLSEERPAEVSRGAILGQKTAVCLPHESRKTGGKCRVFVGILRIL